MKGISVKDVPAAVWWCVTVSFLGVLATFAFLSANQADATEFRSFLNTVMNLAALIVSGGGAIFAGAAAKSAANAERQTNGVLDSKIQAAIAASVDAALNRENLGVLPAGDAAIKRYQEMREGDNGRPTV